MCILKTMLASLKLQKMETITKYLKVPLLFYYRPIFQSREKYI